MTQVISADVSSADRFDVARVGGHSDTPRSSLKQLLQVRGVDYVRAEYSSRDGSGSFNQVLFCMDDGRQTFVPEAGCASHVKALFLAVLTARHPDWCRGEGACGDFRWRPETNELTHTHYTLGEQVERITHHGF
jgi:hypothetical protein